MTYRVIKRIVNDYEVYVEAKSPAEARKKARANDHEPGELTSEFEDGEDYQPSKWLVFKAVPCSICGMDESEHDAAACREEYEA